MDNTDANILPHPETPLVALRHKTGAPPGEFQLLISSFMKPQEHSEMIAPELGDNHRTTGRAFFIKRQAEFWYNEDWDQEEGLEVYWFNTAEPMPALADIVFFGMAKILEQYGFGSSGRLSP